MGMFFRSTGRFGCWLPCVLALSGGCDFFQELESETTEGETESASGTDTAVGETEPTEGSGACEIAVDDACLNQDTVQSCSPTDGMITELDCPSLCGVNTNFSCVATVTGQHACWCVVAGDNKVLSCTELESCLADCGQAQTAECTDRCFGRTDALTVRLFGALLHCAEATCEQTCRDTPANCTACLTSARVGGGGGCSLPRAVCDDDRSPDDPWP